MASQATDPEASSWTAPSGSWASSAAARRSMRGNRNRDTRPEMAVRSAVHALGLRYRVAARPVAGLRRSADLVFRRPRVAVFVDGCFWHGCPDHFVLPRTNVDYWTAKIDRNRARDAETDALLADAGWIVVRVWEHEAPSRGADRVRETLGRG
jgi:DNA mismatch endonuclease, patch repair protein